MEFISVRPLKENDYDDILVGWWKDWGWDPPVKDFLPDNGTGGLIVYHLDNPVCAGFMYMTNSKVSKNVGNKYAYALIKHENLIKTYEGLGYIKGDSYTGEMIKVL